HRPTGFIFRGLLDRRLRRLDQLGVHESYLGLSLLSGLSCAGSAGSAVVSTGDVEGAVDGAVDGSEVGVAVGAGVVAGAEVAGSVDGGVVEVLVRSALITLEASLITSKLSFCRFARSLLRSMPDSCISFWN